MPLVDTRLAMEGTFICEEYICSCYCINFEWTVPINGTYLPVDKAVLFMEIKNQSLLHLLLHTLLVLFLPA